MKILVISDTHGNVNRAFRALALSEQVDTIIHLGDGCADADILRDSVDIPVINIAGNCDLGATAPRELIWECEGKRILLTHGDQYQVKSNLTKLLKRATETGADVALFGHTHQPASENYSGLLLINPGALANHAFYRSYANLDITREGITSWHYNIA